MLGGLPRRGSLVARFARTRPLLVDLGDLAKPDEPNETLLEISERAALDALATLAPESSSAHAIAFGCTEARLGLERLARLSEGHAGKIVWLASNLRSKGSGPLPNIASSLVSDDLIVQAVIDPGLVTPPEGCVLVPPALGLGSPARDPSRRRIVLYHGDAAAAERDLGEVGGIDLVIAGHSEHAEATRRLSSGAFLVTLETKGQRLHGLAVTAPSSRERALRAEESHDLDSLVPDARAAREALDRFYDEATRLVPGWPKKKLDEAGGTFVGSESCRDCHPEAWRVWVESKHGHALERLRAKDPKRAGLAECLRCHTVGFGFESGWTDDTNDASRLGAVGCESCHGPGSNHVNRALAGDDPLGFGRVAGKWPVRWRARCLVCHDPANSPGFDLEPYLEKVRHWKNEER
jgi:hypothetical protein